MFDYQKERIIKSRNPCPICPSSDARMIYESGSSYCFSCGTYFPPKGMSMRAPVPKLPETTESPINKDYIEKLKSTALRDRGISKYVTEFFGVKVEFDEDLNIKTHFYPYENGYKIRRIPKEFSWVGKAGGLFGKEKFPGSNKKLIITEGEIDALSVAEASYKRYEKIFPVVAL